MLTNISFVGTAEQKSILLDWAHKEDRSLSSLLRRIIADAIANHNTQGRNEQAEHSQISRIQGMMGNDR
jgi:hypothetical protein